MCYKRLHGSEAWSATRYFYETVDGAVLSHTPFPSLNKYAYLHHCLSERLGFDCIFNTRNNHFRSEMDKDTMQRLEHLRTRVPRYLFRAWNNTPKGADRLSGGYKGLNTSDAITPLAFFRKKGHKSVYDLSKQAFTNMAASH